MKSSILRNYNIYNELEFHESPFHDHFTRMNIHKEFVTITTVNRNITHCWSKQ